MSLIPSYDFMTVIHNSKLHFVFFLFKSVILFSFLLYSNCNYTNEHKQFSNSKPSQVLKELENFLKLEPFLNELNYKTFNGQWIRRNKTNSTTSFFTSNKGIINLNFEYTNNINYTILSILYSILDDSYKENWLVLKVDYTLYHQARISELNITLPKEADVLPTLFAKYSLKSTSPKRGALSKHNLLRTVSKTLVIVDNIEIDLPAIIQQTVSGNLTINSLNIDISFNCSFAKTKAGYDEKKIGNFAMTLSVIGMISMYYTIILIKQCLNEEINPASISPYFIMVDMLWNASLSVCCVYCAIVFIGKFNEFIIAAVVYLMHFSVFQVRLFYNVYRCNYSANNDGIVDANGDDFKKHIAKIYITFYFVVLFNIVILYFFFIYRFLFLLYILITFLPQMYHNVITKIPNNKILSRYIFFVTVNKLFIPCNLWCVSNNILMSKPHFEFFIYAVIGLGVEILFLHLQHKFGGKFFIPKRFRKNYYNYYKTVTEIEMTNKDFSNSNQICAICLNDLKTDIKIISSTIPIKDSKSEINEEVPINSSNAKCNFSLNVIICKRETHSNILMMTPCHHYFHPECLQEWCKHKSKCPICRHDLPSID